MIQNNTLFIPYESHADGLIEYYGFIAANGSVTTGARGVTVARTGTGSYRLSLIDQVPVYAADLADTNMAASANGTGVTKTCACHVNAVSAGVAATNLMSSAYAGEPVLSTNGSVIFNVITAQMPAAGGASVVADNAFYFKIVVSSMAKEAK
jgi:hypothetical protein